MKRIIMSIIVVLGMLAFFEPIPTYAEGICKDIQDDIVLERISQEGKNFFFSHYRELLKATSSKMNEERIKVCSPFFIYDPIQNNNNEVYYFPIEYNGRIVTVISLINTTAGWSISSSTEMVDGLNSMNYHKVKEKIFYEGFNEIILETKDDVVSIERISNVKENSRKSRYKFANQSFNDKKKEILKGLADTSPVDVKSIQVNAKPSSACVGAYTPTFSSNTSTQKICQLYNARGLQGYPICWAAAVATAVNYRKGTNYSATDICDSIGCEYEAQDIATIDSALDYYNMNYSIAYNQLSWSTIKKNIGNKYPVIVVALTSSLNGHAIDVYGYRTISTSDYVIMWNPGTESSQTIYYNPTGTTFTYNNKVWTWTWSVSMYN